MNDSNLEFLDLLNIMSFIIGVMNYEENLTQSDKQDLMTEVDNQTEKMLNQIHEHLEKQDKQIKEILERMR